MMAHNLTGGGIKLLLSLEYLYFLFSFSLKTYVFLGDENVNISGKIVFPKNVGMLPKPSCLKIKIRDVSSFDVNSHLLAMKIVDLSNVNVEKFFTYTLLSKKPVNEHLNRGYTISAVLNIGWCHRESEFPWLRIGDFLALSEHTIFLQDGQDTYNQNIFVECYSKYIYY